MIPWSHCSFSMKEELTAILDKHRPRLTRELDINGGILNRLLANGVITADHLDDIKVILCLL